MQRFLKFCLCFAHKNDNTGLEWHDGGYTTKVFPFFILVNLKAEGWQAGRWMEIMCLHQTANKTTPHSLSLSLSPPVTNPFHHCAWIIYTDTRKGKAIKFTCGRGKGCKIFVPFPLSRGPQLMTEAVCSHIQHISRRQNIQLRLNTYLWKCLIIFFSKS